MLHIREIPSCEFGHIDSRYDGDAIIRSTLHSCFVSSSEVLNISPSIVNMQSTSGVISNKANVDAGEIKESSCAGSATISSKPVDVFRDTPVRLLGYANEVGESFRALIPLSVVRLSYAVATGYVVADAIDKSWKMMKRNWPDPGERNKQVGLAAVDTLIWQTLASVVIPGFTINRACALSHYVLQRTTSLPSTPRKWATTLIGLSCIPFIIKPIDRSVDLIMEKTLRTWFQLDMAQHEKRNP